MYLDEPSWTTSAADCPGSNAYSKVLPTQRYLPEVLPQTFPRLRFIKEKSQMLSPRLSHVVKPEKWMTSSYSKLCAGETEDTKIKSISKHLQMRHNVLKYILSSTLFRDGNLEEIKFNGTGTPPINIHLNLQKHTDSLHHVIIVASWTAKRR